MTAVTVEIRYDSTDITPLCVIHQTSFTGRANGSPGDCAISVKDVTQTQFFTPGKTLELYLNGTREWDGYLMSVAKTYWFEGHTANCKPCDHLTPRKLILRGADRNIIFFKRVLFNKADPTIPKDNEWPAGTTDDTIILASIADYLDPTDGIDYSTKVETVASPDPYAKIRVPGPTQYLGDMMREIAQSTGAVFYIDPDRFMVYTDVNTVSAPFGISDQPGAGQKGCRQMEVLFRADEMVNDAIIWGAGQGVNHVVSDRVQDATSIALHGRWQNTNGYHTNLFKPASVLRVANSIVYGSPSNKRGHKDDAIAVNCTIFEPGIRVSDKVAVESVVHGYSDVLPVRQMTITFPAGPHNVQYDLHLSQELDEPWITQEYWRPATYEHRCEAINCTLSVPGPPNLAITLAAGTQDPLWEPSKRVGIGEVRWDVNVINGANVWTWSSDARAGLAPWIQFTDPFAPEPGLVSSDPYYQGLPGQTEVTSRYQLCYADELFYGGFFTFNADGIRTAGPLFNTWRTDYRMHRAATNVQFPGGTVTGHFVGTLQLTHYEYDRLHTGGDGGGTGGPYVDGPPDHILVSLLAPKPVGHHWALREIGSVILEADLSHGQSVPLNTYFNFDSGESFAVSVQLWEIRNNHPVVISAEAGLNYTITYHPNSPNAWAYIDGCVEIPVCGRVCVTGVRANPVGSQSISTTGSTLGNTIYVNYAPIYSVPVAYIPGSTQVSIDGLSQRLGIDYTESDPIRGEITLNAALLPSIRGSTLGNEPTVYICFDGAGYIGGANLPAPGAIFIIPTSGYITGTFGAQSGLWPSAFWHGVYYPHFHNGVDFGVGIGTPVYAAAAGVLVWEDQAAGGNMLSIYHSNGMRTVYAHLSQRLVADGKTVAQGDLIGLSGASGDVTGPHLHWGMVFSGSPEDPMPYTAYRSATPSSVPLITGG